jgi:hypothetical protein
MEEMFMKKRKAVNSVPSSNPGVIVAAGVLTVAIASLGLAQPSGRMPNAGAVSDPANVLGIAFDGHQVSNLDQSIRFYEAPVRRMAAPPDG